METVINALEKVIPFLEKYDNWVKWIIASWIFLTALCIILLLFMPRYVQEKKSEKHVATPADTIEKTDTSEYLHEWSLTGDNTIDLVLRNLNSLERKGRANITDIELSTTLTPLFNRPAFYGIREESWEYFLFPLCKSRLILEHYQAYFKSPVVRTEIGKAVQKMVILQNAVATIYGPNFSITQHVKLHIGNSESFISKLPKRMLEPDYKFFTDRDATIKQIKTILKSIGLAD